MTKLNKNQLKGHIMPLNDTKSLVIFATGQVLMQENNELNLIPIFFENKQSFIIFDNQKFSIPFLVATAFLPNPNHYKTVQKIKDTPRNNHVNNLPWIP